MIEPQSLSDRRYTGQQTQDTINQTTNLVEQFSKLNQCLLEMSGCSLQIWSTIAQSVASNLNQGLQNQQGQQFRQSDYSRTA